MTTSYVQKFNSFWNKLYVKKTAQNVRILGNQLNVANILGWHFTIHKGFVELYKRVVSRS